MKLGVETPERLVDVSRLPFDRIEERARRRAAHRRGRAQQRPGGRPRASASATRCSRWRCCRARRASCATSRRPAATCSSARAAPTSRTSRSRATSARPGSGCPAREGDHRNLAILGALGRVRRDAPVGHGRRAGRDRRGGPRHGPEGERTIPIPGLHRLPGDEPAARHGARARRARHRASSSAARRRPRRALDVPQGARPRVVLVRRRVGRRRARGRGRHGRATAGSRSAASPTGRGARGAPRRRCAAGPRRRSASPRRPRPSWPRPQPLRDNAFKVPLARNLLIVDAGRARGGGGVMATTIAPGVRRRRRGPAIEGREKVTGRARVRLRARRRGRRLRLDRPGHDRPRRGRARSTAPRRAAARRARRPLARERAAARRARRRASSRSCSRRASHYRGQIVAIAVAETLEAAREAADLVRVEYDAEAHDVALRADHPKLYTPEKVNPNFPSETVEGDVDAALAAAAVRRRRDVHDAGRAQQPDGAARDARGVERRRPHALRLDAGRAPRAGHDRGRVRDRPRARARDLAARRRRLRLEGAPARRPRSRRRSRPGTSTGR